jgi:CBS domain-containing protein
VDRAAAIVQKVAVRPARHAEPHTVGCTVNVLALKSGCAHTEKPGGTHQIRLRQINEALLPAALGTPRLAFKPDFLRHRAPLRIIIMCDTTCNASTFVIYFLLSIGEGAMSRVSDIVCQRELFRVEEYDSVAEVARKMADLHVGAILVFNGDRLRGIFSERDLMKRVVVERCDPERTAVGLVMSTDVATIDDSASLEEAMESMQSHNCRHLPVTREGMVVAFLSMRDLMNFELAQKTEEIHHMRQYISNA